MVTNLGGIRAHTRAQPKHSYHLRSFYHLHYVTMLDGGRMFPLRITDHQLKMGKRMVSSPLRYVIGSQGSVMRRDNEGEWITVIMTWCSQAHIESEDFIFHIFVQPIALELILRYFSFSFLLRIAIGLR